MLRRWMVSQGKVVENGERSEIYVYVSPDEAERRELIDTLQVDEHTLNSSLDPDELPRLEIEPAHVAMILKRPMNYSFRDNFLFKVASAGVFLFEDRLIVVIGDEVPLFDGKMFQRVGTLRDLLLRLIYRWVQHFVDHLKGITMVSESLEHKINTAMDNKHLYNMFTLEKSLVYYLNAIHANSGVLERLRHNAAKLGFTPEDVEFLDDLIIENNQCFRQAEIHSNILASMMDARASIVSNNLNVLMKTLTIITIGIMVPTFVVSAFSMNVRIPFEDWPYAFFLIMGFATASVAILVALWRWRQW